MKLSFAHGIVSGMNYLHSLDPPVIHSDLKTENILISETLVAKVSRFYRLTLCKGYGSLTEDNVSVYRFVFIVKKTTVLHTYYDDNGIRCEKQ